MPVDDFLPDHLRRWRSQLYKSLHLVAYLERLRCHGLYSHRVERPIVSRGSAKLFVNAAGRISGRFEGRDVGNRDQGLKSLRFPVGHLVRRQIGSGRLLVCS